MSGKGNRNPQARAQPLPPVSVIQVRLYLGHQGGKPCFGGANHIGIQILIGKTGF